MPIKAKEKSLDEMKKDAIKNSVDVRGYAKGGMVKKPMSYKDGGKVMKDKEKKSMPPKVLAMMMKSKK
jgi:hypothetical protein